MITPDEMLRDNVDKESKDALLVTTDLREKVGELTYLNYIMGIRQEEMLQILYTAGLLNKEQHGRGPDHEGLSAAWEKAKALNGTRA